MSMLIITHPNKPGAGEMILRGAEGRIELESAIASCTHCQRTIQLHKKDEPYGYCRQCDAPICPICVPEYVKDGCKPWKMKVDNYLEDQYRISQSYPIAT